MRRLPAALCLLLSTLSPALAGTVSEVVKTYPVEGRTAGDLYASIGRNGPMVGGVRVIAHTGFKLTWRRDYVREGNACVLASAVPKLVITYTLPKPRGTLAEPLRTRWQAFSDGIAAHERIHGDHARALVAEIEAATIGFRQENDPGCKAIRKAIIPALKAASDRRAAKSAEFDRIEMAPDGAVGRLVLDFLNGG